MRARWWHAVVLLGALVLGIAASCNAILGFDLGERAAADAGPPAGGSTTSSLGGSAGAAGHGGESPVGDVWSARFGDARQEILKGLAVDGDGSMYLVGGFEGQLNFGCGELHNAGEGPEDIDGYVAKLNADGSCAWSNSFSDGGEQRANGVAVHGGSVFVVGVFEGDLNPGCVGAHQAAGGTDAFIVQFDAQDGGCLRVGHYGDATNQGASRVVVDESGHIYVAGAFAGAIDFGAGALSADAGRDLYVVELHEAGGTFMPDWSAQVRVSGISQVRGLLHDGQADPAAVYLLAQYEYDGGLGFGGSGGAGAGGAAGGAGGASGNGLDVLLARFDADTGQRSWSETLGGEDDDHPHGAAISHEGNILVCGTYEGEFAVVGGSVSSAESGSNDMFIAGVTAERQFFANHPWQATGWDAALGIAVDSQGDILVGGIFGGDLSVVSDVCPAQSAGGQDIFVGKLNASATDWLTCQSFGGPEDQILRALAIDDAGNLVIAGEFAGRVDFGDGPLEAVVGPSITGPDGGTVLPPDLFVARLPPP